MQQRGQWQQQQRAWRVMAVQQDTQHLAVLHAVCYSCACMQCAIAVPARLVYSLVGPDCDPVSPGVPIDRATCAGVCIVGLGRTSVSFETESYSCAASTVRRPCILYSMGRLFALSWIPAAGPMP